jgi:protein-S-isoprenylcysteine O-methyltransferase Ste14
MNKEPLPSPSPPSEHNLVDFGIRAALGLIFAFEAGICSKKAIIQLQGLYFTQFNPNRLSEALAILAIGLFYMIIACLYAVRLRPVRRTSGAWPRAAAILGAFLTSGLLLLNQRTDLPLAAQVAASVLVLSGNGLAIYVLTHLGRSFSILPESRKLVTSGPYHVVRHPLYLAEAVATLGILVQFISPWALLLVASQIAFQIIRIHYEEKILRQTFPEYGLYSQHTWQLIPMIY